MIWTGCEAAKTPPFSMPVFKSWIDINVILGFASFRHLGHARLLAHDEDVRLAAHTTSHAAAERTMAFTRSLPQV